MMFSVGLIQLLDVCMDVAEAMRVAEEFFVLA